MVAPPGVAAMIVMVEAWSAGPPAQRPPRTSIPKSLLAGDLVEWRRAGGPLEAL